MAIGQLVGDAITRSGESYDTVRSGHVWNSAGEFADAGGAIYPGIGHGIGAIIGMIYGMSTANKVGDDWERQKREEQEMQRKARYDADKAALAGVQTQGNDSVGYFKFGGKMYDVKAVAGGYLDLLGKGTGTTEVKGNTHAQGGVDVISSKGNLAEVEGGEVMYGNGKILSKELGFAGIAKEVMNSPLAKKQAADYESTRKRLESKRKSIEANLKSTDNLAKSTAERELEILQKEEMSNRHPLDDLFDTQEAYKATNGFTVPTANKPKALYGMSDEDWNKTQQYIGTSGRFVDNVANFINETNRPNVPKPELASVRSLDTKMQVGDQVQVINDSRANMFRNIEAGTSSSKDAMAFKAMANANALNVHNTVMGNKSRVETDLRNRNTMFVNSQERANNALINQYKGAKYEDKLGMLADRNANFANMSADFQQMGAEGYQAEVDRKSLSMITSLRNRFGTLSRFDNDFVQRYVTSNPNATEEEVAQALITYKGQTPEQMMQLYPAPPKIPNIPQ